MADIHHKFLCLAIDRAKESVALGGFPAGSVLVKDDVVLAEGVSIGALIHDPTSHSDIAAIRAACEKENTADLSGAVLYSSVQPCLMCMGAASWAGVSKIFYACSQDVLDAGYYGGHYKGHAINQSLLQPMEMVHRHDLESQSMDVVCGWKKSPT